MQFVKKLSHKKVKHITYLDKPQDYIKSKKITHKMISTLFNLRTRCLNEFKENSHNLKANMDFFIFKSANDTQEHGLTCPELRKHLSEDHRQTLVSVQYSDIFGSLNKQIIINQVFQNIIKTQQRLREKMKHEQAYHGPNSSGPSG